MKKHYGQHLLVDKNHLSKIIKNINLSSSDIVLEIGAGTGLLTCELAKVAKKVVAVEPEREILKKLKENIKSANLSNVEILESGFLRLDLAELMKKKFIVTGNIPYNITSQILIKLFGEIDKPAPHLTLLDRVFLMFQLEVAERLTAKPGTKAYSPLTLLIQYFTDPKILYKVPRTVFYPKPRVDSAFVSFNLKNKFQHIENPTLVKNVVRTSFQQRRKKIINSLNKLIKDKSQISEILKRNNLDENLRAEDLSMSQYIQIADSIMQLQ